MPSTILPIALLLAAACALINLWLPVRIGQVRRREKLWVGDAGSEPLLRRMRAQANLIDDAPLVVALVALIELSAGTNPWLAILAGLFVAARLAHPFGIDGWVPGRVFGAATTMLVQLLLAFWAVAIPIVAHHDVRRAEPVETTRSA